MEAAFAKIDAAMAREGFNQSGTASTTLSAGNKSRKRKAGEKQSTYNAQAAPSPYLDMSTTNKIKEFFDEPPQQHHQHRQSQSKSHSASSSDFIATGEDRSTSKKRTRELQRSQQRSQN
jgi:hypothetical protein